MQTIAYSVVLTQTGRLYSAGLNSHGKLGDGRKPTCQTFQEVQPPEGTRFKHVSVGTNHCIAVLEDGRLCSWGWNNRGQLGLGLAKTRTVYSPTIIPNAEDFISVAAGSNFSIALKSNGEVWGFGSNNKGQLGCNHKLRQASNPTTAQVLSQIRDIEELLPNIPKITPQLKSVITITVGYHHTLCSWFGREILYSYSHKNRSCCANYGYRFRIAPQSDP
jgi:alpha-tubulin suppressor-like RCC1 family protein